MSNTTSNASVRARQQGMALIAAMLMLVVITLLGVAMFRSYGLEQRIGGNTRDKSRAFHAATLGQSTGEQWLTLSNGVNASTGSTCDAVYDGNSASGMRVCSNLIQDDVQNVPWPSYVTFVPPNMSVGTDSAVLGNYAEKPALYISFLSATPPGAGIYASTYQIDAVGYGSSPSSIAVVESVYSVQHFKTTEAVTKGAPPNKNVNLGGT
jgi:type IV pilus assembly protein PilX